MIYDRQDLERILPVFFNGGVGWESEFAPDADMPKAQGNPAIDSDERAEQVDMQRAWQGVTMASPEGVALMYGHGVPASAAAKILGVGKARLINETDADMALLCDRMNGVV